MWVALGVGWVGGVVRCGLRLNLSFGREPVSPDLCLGEIIVLGCGDPRGGVGGCACGRD